MLQVLYFTRRNHFTFLMNIIYGYFKIVARFLHIYLFRYLTNYFFYLIYKSYSFILADTIDATLHVPKLITLNWPKMSIELRPFFFWRDSCSSGRDTTGIIALLIFQSSGRGGEENPRRITSWIQLCLK